MVAYVVEGKRRRKIALINLENKKEEQHEVPFMPMKFNWFPDNKSIAIVGFEGSDAWNPTENIYLYSTETHKITKISNYPEGEKNRIHSMCISDDGKSIILATSGSDRRIKVLKLNIVTKGITTLPFVAFALASMPNRNTVAISGKEISDADRHVPCVIFLYDLDTGQYKKVNIAENLNDFQWIESMSFSPDGKKLAYVRVENPGAKTLWTMNIDGSNKRELISENYFITNLNWTE